MLSAHPPRKNFLLLALVFLIFAAGITVAAHRHLVRQRAAVETEVRHELEAIAEMKIRQVAAWRQERFGDAQMVQASAALMPELRGVLSGSNDAVALARVRSWMESWFQHQGYANAILLDAAGRVRLAVGNANGAPQHYSALAQAALRAGQVIFRDFHRDEGLPGVHLGMSIPLASAQSKPFGVLLLGIDPDRFLYPLIQTWPTPSRTAETLLVRKEGNEIVFLNKLRHENHGPLALRLPASQPDLAAAMAVRGREGAMDAVDYRGVPVLAAARPIPDTPWYLISKIDAAEIQTPLQKESVLLILMAGALIAAAGAGTALVWRSQRARFYQQKYEADRALRALMGHYDYLSRYANDIILLVRENGDIVEANDRAIAAYGYTREELLGKKLRDLRHPSALAEFDAQWAKVAERDGYVFETLHRRRDGAAFPVEVSMRLIEVDSTGFRQSIIRDISDRRTMQERLRQANDKLSAIIEAAPVGIIAVDRDARIRLWNKAAERIYGWTVEEVLDRPMPESVWSCEDEDGQEMWRQLAAGKAFTGVEATRHRKDGATVQVNLTSAPLFDADGKKMGAMAVVADVTERKRAEDALRESELRAQMAVEASNTGLWDWDLRTESVYYSKEWKAQLGYADDEISDDYAEWESRLHPEDRERAVSAVKRYLGDPSSAFESEFRMRHKDGSYRWILARGALVRDASGNPWRMAGSHLDFTERKAIEEELRQNRRLVQRMLDATPDLLYIHDIEADRNLFANKPAAEFFGYTAEEVRALGAKWLDRILHPEDAAAVAAHHRRCRTAADGEVLEIEYRMRHADGSWRWLHSRDVVFARNENGLGTQILGLAQDVTERRRAEEALRTSEARLERAQEIASLGNWEAGAIRLNGERDPAFAWSDEVYRIFGVSKDRFTPDHDSFNAMVHPDDRERVRSAFMASVASGKPYGIEHRIVRPDGTVRYVREQAEPEIDETGAVRMIGTVQDITEYKRLQDQFLQAQRLESVGRLAGGVAHDFNNLLTVIIGYTDLLLAQVESDADLAMPMEEIKKAAERAADLTGQLLAFSRKQIVQPRTLDVNALIAEIEKMLRRLIGEDIELICHLGSPLSPIVADPGQITQVLMNLAVNARDAMPHGGKLIVETRNVVYDTSYAEKHPYVSAGAYVLLTVSDTGSGMSEETRNHLFEPFFTTKEKGKGTGLGLSTVYGIVKQAGGHIWVYSEMGVGTTFNICLPQTESGTGPVESAIGTAAEIRGSETVLVVEDQDEVRRLACDVLKGYGYNVLEAGGGEEALDLCRRHTRTIHLLLTDVVMPGMTGRELADNLKELRPDIRILFMSGYTDNVIVHHGALDAQMAYIQKPFSPVSLALKVRETLGPGVPGI